MAGKLPCDPLIVESEISKILERRNKPKKKPKQPPPQMTSIEMILNQAKSENSVADQTHDINAIQVILENGVIDKTGGYVNQSINQLGSGLHITGSNFPPTSGHSSYSSSPINVRRPHQPHASGSKTLKIPVFTGGPPTILVQKPLGSN